MMDLVNSQKRSQMQEIVQIVYCILFIVIIGWNIYLVIYIILNNKFRLILLIITITTKIRTIITYTYYIAILSTLLLILFHTCSSITTSELLSVLYCFSFSINGLLVGLYPYLKMVSSLVTLCNVAILLVRHILLYTHH